MRLVVQAARTASAAEYPVLIEGESGTGKELVARIIHGFSRRATGAFVGENCAALPESLVEAECFGHEKGAFTGAVCRQPGLFELANGGTLFLDEVGEMSLSLQRKLLRVLQERQIRRVGGREPVSVDFRLISATNRSLESMVAAGEFRRDLFYRLHVAIISVPPLRERPEDIPALLAHFATTLSVETRRPPVGFSEAAMMTLARYPWPGNVRELRNEVLRLTCSGVELVGMDSLSPRILREIERGTGRRPPVRLEGRSLEEIEREAVGGAILEAISSSRGNLAEAARLLRIPRASLYRRIGRYRLQTDFPRGTP
jgi:transcriptional regulator with PAS, ATPase and Fis domain